MKGMRMQCIPGGSSSCGLGTSLDTQLHMCKLFAESMRPSKGMRTISWQDILTGFEAFSLACKRFVPIKCFL